MKYKVLVRISTQTPKRREEKCSLGVKGAYPSLWDERPSLPPAARLEGDALGVVRPVDRTLFEGEGDGMACLEVLESALLGDLPPNPGFEGGWAGILSLAWVFPLVGVASGSTKQLS